MNNQIITVSNLVKEINSNTIIVKDLESNQYNDAQATIVLLNIINDKYNQSTIIENKEVQQGALIHVNYIIKNNICLNLEDILKGKISTSIIEESNKTLSFKEIFENKAASKISKFLNKFHGEATDEELDVLLDKLNATVSQIKGYQMHVVTY